MCKLGHVESKRDTLNKYVETGGVSWDIGSLYIGGMDVLVNIPFP